MVWGWLYTYRICSTSCAIMPNLGRAYYSACCVAMWYIRRVYIFLNIHIKVLIIKEYLETCLQVFGQMKYPTNSILAYFGFDWVNQPWTV
jgi:hypothetical protein